MKKILLCFLVTILFGLTSCSKKIPDGDIKDFVSGFKYSNAFEHVNNAKSITTIKHYENKQEDGCLEMEIWIDKSDIKYRYSKSFVSGYFYGDKEGQYTFNNQETLCYTYNDEEIFAYQKTDNVYDDIKYSPDDVSLSIDNFFYTELEAGIYRGGFYYGDYVRINCANFYNQFSLNEAKTELTYSINTVTKDRDGYDILTMHSFTVDSYGMLLSLSSTAKNNAKGLKTETITKIVYNTSFEKIMEL